MDDGDVEAPVDEGEGEGDVDSGDDMQIGVGRALVTGPPRISLRSSRRCGGRLLVGGCMERCAEAGGGAALEVDGTGLAGEVLAGDMMIWDLLTIESSLLLNSSIVCSSSANSFL